jgi:hypothetical protein
MSFAHLMRPAPQLTLLEQSYYSSMALVQYEHLLLKTIASTTAWSSEVDHEMYRQRSTVFGSHLYNVEHLRKLRAMSSAILQENANPR